MVAAFLAIALLAAGPGPARMRLPASNLIQADSLIRAGEHHFLHLWQVKPRGNACPRWSSDGEGLVFEADGKLLDVDEDRRSALAPSVRYATSPSFSGSNLVFSGSDVDSLSSMATRWKAEKWSLAPGSQIYVQSHQTTQLTQAATAMESNTSADGKQIVFTMALDNDPELYVMNADGSNVRRLTSDFGYDGAGAFSPDGQLICYQAFHPQLETDKAIHTDLLAKHLFDSSTLDIWVMHADGSERGQVTDLEGTSMEPSFTPDSKRIIFSSDYQDVPGRQFDLYITKLDGGTPEKITDDPSPDCFPAFSPNGRYLAFTSGRGSKSAGAQNVFIAEWKE